MTRQIVVPKEWTKLTPHEKELALEWLKNIILAKVNQQKLTQLLASKSVSSKDFLKTTNNISIETDQVLNLFYKYYELINSDKQHSNTEKLLEEDDVNSFMNICLSITCTSCLDSPYTDCCKEYLQNHPECH